MTALTLRPTLPPAAQATLDALYADAIAVDPAARAAAAERGLASDADPGFYAAMRTAYLPVTPDFGALLYVLARAQRARAIVEFGTSFGISTIYLAAAARATGGRVIATELDPDKAARARANLARAELADVVELRTGDAADALRANLPARVDLLFLDGPKSLYLPICKLVEPHLGAGSIVASDNSEMASAADYLAYIRDPINGYRGCSLFTSALGDYHGHELAIKD